MSHQVNELQVNKKNFEFSKYAVNICFLSNNSTCSDNSNPNLSPNPKPNPNPNHFK